MEMNLENVIDKLSSKIGIAVEQLKPVADEVLRQYRAEQTVYIIMWSIISLVVLAVAVYLVVKAVQMYTYDETLQKDRRKDRNCRPDDSTIDDDMITGMFVGCGVCFLFGVLFLIILCGHVANYVSPLVQLLL